MRSSKNQSLKRGIKHVHKHAKHVVSSTKDHFIPHAGNDHHPHVLQHHVLFGYSAILVLLKIVAITAGFGITNLNTNATAITPANIIALVNQARATEGIPVLKNNNQLAQAAAAKAQDMLVNQYFAHTSPNGVTPWHWINQSGYIYQHSAENLAVHYKEAENVQSGWMASPSHKKNILNPDFVDTGVGIATGKFEDYDTIFVVQMFGKPVTEEPVINNETVQSTSTEEVLNPTDTNLLRTEQKIETAQVMGTEDAVITTPTMADVKISPSGSGYNVQAQDSQASTIKIEIGQANTILDKENDSWSGSIVRLPPENTSNIPMLLTGKITDKNGLTTEQPLAWVMQGSSLNSLYSTNQKIQSAKLFGILSREGIQKGIQTFYLFLLVFLFGSLTLYVFTKFHIQNIGVISHTVSVIGLIIILLLS